MTSTKEQGQREAIEILKQRLQTAVTEIRQLSELLWKAQAEITRLRSKLNQNGDRDA